MRVPVIALAGLALAAALPGSASAAAPGLVLVADGPVTFSAPTAKCPIGIATASVTVAGTGESVVSTGCAKKGVPCGPGCTRFRITYEIPLAGGTIRDTVQQRQVSAPDRLVTGVSQRGTVTSATGVYAGLVGAPVNGGGAIIVMPDGTLHLNLATAITPLS
jgi:hypothetical protein